MGYAITLIFEDSAVDEDKYWAVNEALGIDRAGKGDWPKGMLVHAGGPLGADGWMVTEVWESRADQEAFMANRLGPALGKVGVPQPARVVDTDTVNVFQA